MFHIAFLVLAAARIVRFIRAGGISMLRVMSTPMDEDHVHHERRGAGGNPPPGER